MFPPSSRFLVPLLLALLLGLNGCLQRGIPVGSMPGAEFSVMPSLACPGDTITFTWDTHRPFSPAFCHFPNGNTSAVLSCSFSAQCSTVGGQCIDSFCNNCRALDTTRQTDCAQPSNVGCQANMAASLEVIPASKPPVMETAIRQHRGERSFVVRESSTVAFRGTVLDTDGHRAGLANSIGRIDADLQIEVVDPDLTRIVPNTFECRGSPRWPGVLLQDLFVGASPRLRLGGIYNPNRFAVVGNLNGFPMRLEAGERVSLNLSLEGTVQAQPDPVFLSTLPPVLCSATHDTGSGYPSAPLEVTVGCITPP